MMLEFAIMSALVSTALFLGVLFLERFLKIVGESDLLRNKHKARMKVERDRGEKYARDYIKTSLTRTLSSYIQSDRIDEADAVKDAISSAGL